MSRSFKIFESFTLGAFFGFVPVIFCFSLAILIYVLFFEGKLVPVWTLSGVAAGIIIDVVLLKSWISKAYRINSKILALLYTFYSVVTLGMCMGIPILNFALAIAAGLYIARKMQLAGAGEQVRKRNFKKTAIFCAAVMTALCFFVMLWAIAGQMIGYRFEMGKLSFTFTVPVFFALVFTGTAALALLQYTLARTSATAAFRLLAKSRK
jgi:hypothetical protein